jgi:AraC family transcriptional regulator
MLSLKNGIYLGKLDKSVSDVHINACITSYHHAERYDKMHCHENAHISFVLSGGSVEKRINREIERGPGKITFYHSEEYHQSSSLKDSSRHVNLELRPEFFVQYGIDEIMVGSMILKNPDAKFLLVQICRELLMDDQWSADSIKMILLQSINQHLIWQKNKGNHLWLSKIDEILRENPSEKISLSYLSDILQVHPVTISRQFHKFYSCTLGEYIRKLKIEKALILVKSSAHSLTDIAYECGFADQSHFIRTFKNFTGFLPHHYKKL